MVVSEPMVIILCFSLFIHVKEGEHGHMYPELLMMSQSFPSGITTIHSEAELIAF